MHQALTLRASISFHLETVQTKNAMQDIAILNQLINDDEGTYRLRIGSHIGYLTIDADVFDEDTMCRPYVLIPKLPPIPKSGWTRMTIMQAVLSNDADNRTNQLDVTTTNDPLPEVEILFHSRRIDILSLEETKTEWHKSTVGEVMYNRIPAICKYAAFEWQIPQLERETWAYSILADA